MSDFSLNSNCQDLARKLQRLSETDYKTVTKLNLREIYNRGKQIGGTPFRTGELRQSLGLTASDSDGYVVGYTKEYAPHVEFGHRTVGGGYVAGQHFFKRNIDMQRNQYKQDLLTAIRRAGG